MSTPASPDRPVVGEGLLNPLAVASVLVLVLNDHWGKAHFHGRLTGKLSDFAGLIFFPLVLQALWELAQGVARRPWRPSLRALAVAALVTAVVFSLVKSWPPASEAYRLSFGLVRWPLDAGLAWVRGAQVPSLSRVSLTADRTDLMAVPAVLLALVAARRRCAGADSPVAPEPHAAH